MERREKRLLGLRKCNKKMLANESTDDRPKRLTRNSEYKKQIVANESPKDREERLLRNHKYNKQMLANWKQKQLDKVCRKANNIESIVHLTRLFHKSVFQGPVYNCTCFNQLWYKHSVCTAEKLRLSKRKMLKYLTNRTSIDNLEWLCQSCNRYLAKDKIPPCAVRNRILFPTKPEFLVLNELECRQLAPTIAFQKLMQAPRGKQLKINEKVVNVSADVTSTINMLSRLPDETRTIKVQLKDGYSIRVLHCL